MRASWGLLACVLAAPACLSSPSPPGGAADAAPPDDIDADVVPAPDAQPTKPDCVTTSELSIDFTDESSLEDWVRVGPDGCSAVTDELLQFENPGTPLICRRYRDLGLDLADQALAIRVAEAGSGTSLSFSIVLHDADTEFGKRIWYYMERNGSLLHLGRCDQASCADMALGLETFSEPEHVHWRFRHDAAEQELFAEVSADGVSFDVVGMEQDITAEQVACVGVDLASYEEESGRAGTVAFDDLRTE